MIKNVQLINEDFVEIKKHIRLIRIFRDFNFKKRDVVEFRLSYGDKKSIIVKLYVGEIVDPNQFIASVVNLSGYYFSEKLEVRFISDDEEKEAMLVYDCIE